MGRRGLIQHAGIAGLALVAVARLVSGCGGPPSYNQPLGTLTYSTPNTLPPPWTATVWTEGAATAVAGWQAYRGVDVELSLPSGFAGGDPVAQREELLSIARAAGPGYEGIVRALDEQPESLRFYAWELEQYEMTVAVTFHDVLAEMSVETYLSVWADSVVQQFPEFEEVSQGPVQIGGQTVGRAVLDLTQDGSVTRQISYLFKQDASVWVLGYAFPAERYVDLVPIVERSVQTFLIVPN